MFIIRVDGGQFVQSQKMGVVIPFLTINITNRNRCSVPKSIQRLVLSNFHRIDRTQLSAADESVVVDYILEINLTKRQTIKNVFIHFQWAYLIKIDVGETQERVIFYDVSYKQNCCLQ